MSSTTDKVPSKDDRKSVLEASSGVYEMQLTQLQEQLIAAMIDNQTLKSELTELKEKHKVDTLLHELEFEQKKTKQLYEELRKAKKTKHPSFREDFVDVAQEVTEDIDLSKDAFISKKLSWFEMIRNYLISSFYELLADFSEEPHRENGADGEVKELTVKQLKENILRFKCGVSPVFYLCKAFFSMLSWKSPLSTLLIFIVYLYTVWCGWLLSVLLLMAIFMLSVQYLQIRGWNINFGFFSVDEENSEKNGDVAGIALSDKFNLVLQVAKQVQNVLGEIADDLEKMKNLLTWHHPSSTRLLFAWLWIAFILSCVTSGPTLFRCIALYMGLKMFVIEYIYDRFPRFKHRHDSVYRIWKELPTDDELERRRKKFLIDQQIIGKGKDSISDIDVLEAFTAESELSYEVQNFCTLFGLPLSEKPLSGWEGGWRVTLVDKSRPLLKSISRNGRLYLTNSFLCLERYKTPSPKNIMIPLKDITRIDKAKPYSWLPGSGMSIEISIVGFEQPYTFGAILNRDECFDHLVSHGSSLHLLWAMEHADDGKKLPDKTEVSEMKGSPDKLPAEKAFRMSDLRDSLDYDDLTLFAS